MRLLLFFAGMWLGYGLARAVYVHPWDRCTCEDETVTASAPVSFRVAYDSRQSGRPD